MLTLIKLFLKIERTLDSHFSAGPRYEPLTLNLSLTLTLTLTLNITLTLIFERTLDSSHPTFSFLSEHPTISFLSGPSIWPARPSHSWVHTQYFHFWADPRTKIFKIEWTPPTFIFERTLDMNHFQHNEARRNGGSNYESLKVAC